MCVENKRCEFTKFFGIFFLTALFTNLQKLFFIAVRAKSLLCDNKKNPHSPSAETSRVNSRSSTPGVISIRCHHIKGWGWE